MEGSSPLRLAPRGTLRHRRPAGASAQDDRELYPILRPCAKQATRTNVSRETFQASAAPPRRPASSATPIRPPRPFLHVQKLPLDNSSLAQYYTYTPIGTKMHRRTTHEGDDGHARTLAGTTRRTARSRRHEKGRRAAGRVGRRAGIQLLRARDAALQPGLDRHRAVRRAHHPGRRHRAGDGVRHQGRRARIARAHRGGGHRRGLRRRRGSAHHAAGRAAGGPDGGEGPRRHRAARASVAPHGAHRARRCGNRRRRRGRAGGRRAARAARRNRGGGRHRPGRTHLHRRVGDDRRIAAGRQGAGRRGEERDGEPVRGVRHARPARGRTARSPA